MVPLSVVDSDGNEVDERDDLGGGATGSAGTVESFDWDPERKALKYGEEEIDLPRFKEIYRDHQNKAQWQASNTQERMKLKDMEREVEKARQLEALLNQHPDLYPEVEKLFKSRLQPQNQQGGQQMSPEIQEQLARMKELETNLTTQNAKIELKEEMADLKSRYAEDFKDMPDLEKKIIDLELKTFESKGYFPDLEMALRFILHDRLLASGISKGQQKLKAAQKNSQLLGMPKGSKGMPVDMKKDILGTKKMGSAIEKYLDAIDGSG